MALKAEGYEQIIFPEASRTGSLIRRVINKNALVFSSLSTHYSRRSSEDFPLLTIPHVRI